MMIICADRFDYPDQNDPLYSAVEVDIYAWIPPMFGEMNHRLSLRKNLFSEQFEVYRIYHRTNNIEVVFRDKTLEKALDFTNGEWNKYHNKWSQQERLDQACKHAEPVRSMFCARNRKRW